MKLLSIKPSTRKDKKYQATFDVNGKQIVTHFGQKSYRDFTLINDKNSKYYISDPGKREKVRQAYLKRHANERWMKPLTAGSLSRFVLWNKPTLSASIRDYKRKFNL